MKDTWTKIGFGFFLSSTVLLIAVLYMGLIDDRIPAEVFDVRIDSDIYYPGDSIIVEIDYCKYTNADAISDPWLRGPVEVNYGNRISSNIEPSCGTLEVEYEIPHEILHGDYRIETTLNYEINFLFDRSIRWQTPVFHIEIEQ